MFMQDCSFFQNQYISFWQSPLETATRAYALGSRDPTLLDSLIILKTDIWSTFLIYKYYITTVQ